MSKRKFILILKQQNTAGIKGYVLLCKHYISIKMQTTITTSKIIIIKNLSLQQKIKIQETYTQQ